MAGRSVPPGNVVVLGGCDARSLTGWRSLGRAAGAIKAGLNLVTLAPGERGTQPHCHALEEELFYVLAGSGALLLGGEEYPLDARGCGRPSAVDGGAHSLRAGDEGLTYLVYGTSEPGDSVFYPESGKVRLRGLGVTLDVS